MDGIIKEWNGESGKIIDIASNDAGTNGLKLGGTLVTKSAADINNLSTDAEATAVAVSMAIALG